MTTQPPLPSKLTAPSAERCLPRPRLFDRLDNGSRLTWIAAPAGAGKTTLVSGWMQARGLTAIWYHIDAGDADPAAFFAYLGQAALAIAAPGGQPLPALTPEYAWGLPTFARNFFRQLWRSAEACRLLVLDDYHDLPADVALHGMLRHGLEETPDDCRVVIISRSEAPPELAKLRLSGDFTCFDWRDLRLDDEECLSLAQQRLNIPLAPDSARALNRRIGGWATGLVLMLERGSIDDGDRLADDPLLFDFFAAEILAGLEPELRDFLLRCALLPEIRPAAAAELTGRPDAEALLSSLARRNLFTVRHRNAAGDSYEFHPLFRQFLLGSGPRQFSAEVWRGLTGQAANILCGAGNYEAGVALFFSIGDWPAMAEALLAWAPQLLAAGRIAGLSAWLHALPDAVLDRQPWLRYYQGVCRLPVDPADARRFYALAYAGFDVRGEALGSYSAWIAVCASFIFAFENIAAADPWLEALPGLRQRYPEFPGEEIEAGVLTFSLFLPNLCHPDTPGLEEIALRLEDLTPNIRDPQLKVSAASNLLMYWLGVRGDSLCAERLTARFAADSLAETTPPLVRLMWETMHAFHYWLSADMASLELALRRSLNFAESCGVRVLDFYFRLQTVLIPAYRNDRRGVTQALAGLLPYLSTPRSYDAYQYHFLRLLEAKVHRDSAAIRDAAREVERYAERTEILSCSLYAGLAAAWRKQAENDISAALRMLDQAKADAPGCGSVVAQWDTLYAELELARFRAKPDAEPAALAAFLRFGSHYGLLNCYGVHWNRPALAGYCVTALEQGIEPEYTRRLIHKHQLMPDPPPIHLEAWPWQVRIRTLGRFEIEIDGVPLMFSSSRVPVKPLELLKALIGFGCRDVSQERLSDALWPETDGDAARRAFYTNLHRLRALLGEESLILSDGRLSLNPQRCRVDIALFDSGRFTVNGHSGVLAWSDALLIRLDGDFLPHDRQLAWTAEPRQRLARARLDALQACLRYWEAHGDSEQIRRCRLALD